MPWCPRCDETFPQGPACPRCSARLVAREHETYEDALQGVPGLKSIRVPRRHLKAFERMSGPRASGSRALALALVMLVFASGFLLGRVGSMTGTSGGPVVSDLPASKPLAIDDAPGVPAVVGSVAYLVHSRDGLATIASHDLYNGTVEGPVRLTPPIDDLDAYTVTKVVSYERSFAVVVSTPEGSHVAAVARGRPAQAWVPGVEAAWLSERDLLVRNADGAVRRWSLSNGGVSTAIPADVDQLIQTAAGPVVRRGTVLESLHGPQRQISLPRRAEVLAVAPDLSRVLLNGNGPRLWDGERYVLMRTGKGEPLGATFDRSSERVAITLRTGDSSQLAVMDHNGNVSLKPLAGRGCEGPPVWDGESRFVYVAGGEGVMHAVEASGGRVESIRTQAVGCGLAWVDTR